MSDKLIPDAFLLAAGLGTRMRPLSEKTPKPLIKVAGKSLLSRVMSALRAEGVEDFVINAHHLAHQIHAFADSVPMDMPGISCTVSDEDELLDTGGGMKKALPLLKSDPVLVANTDTFWDPAEDKPLARMVARFTRGDVDAVLLCAHPARTLGFRRSHDFCLDPNQRIALDTGVPVIYAGVALIARHLFEDTPDGPFSANLIFDRLHEQGRLGGALLNASWYHVGDPEARDEVTAKLTE